MLGISSSLKEVAHLAASCLKNSMAKRLRKTLFACSACLSSTCLEMSIATTSLQALGPSASARTRSGPSVTQRFTCLTFRTIKTLEALHAELRFRCLILLQGQRAHEEPKADQLRHLPERHLLWWGLHVSQGTEAACSSVTCRARVELKTKGY